MNRKSESPKRSVAITILAVIGGVSIVVALGLWGKDQWRSYTTRTPWPVPYRDCLTTGAPPLSDVDLITRAIAQREYNLRRYSDAYKKQYVDGPVLPEKSRVYRWTTPRSQAEMKPLKPGTVAPGYYDGHMAAGLGLKHYVRVELALETVSHSGVAREYSNFDVCGQGF
jgi:hypothetical protein